MPIGGCDRVNQESRFMRCGVYQRYAIARVFKWRSLHGENALFLCITLIVF
ncbi:hypothetical protein H6G81_22160 [Scytonema hofmannii FACHB-248]|uniref:Uncharacterized protein n=1 Tax=Scytonema hofmannii FACHB-248 TaxID=1842502 RepID=A0ABR8GUH6_9CYAN|nr:MULTISPECIES: hypothetical protein [Nostocales]MBD2607157.1 hypothetical protein [Scytonema hofmannii FACHB-248]